jgi:hypothetical protein
MVRWETRVPVKMKKGTARMPFSKHVVDPAHIETMRAAFQKVCAALQLDCKPGEPLTADSDDVAQVYRFDLARAFRFDLARRSGMISPGCEPR